MRTDSTEIPQQLEDIRGVVGKKAFFKTALMTLFLWETLEATQERKVDRAKADQLKQTRKTCHEWVQDTESFGLEVHLIR